MTRHTATRCCWIQDDVRNKQITLRKSKGTENVTDMDTVAPDGKHIMEWMKMLPATPHQCRRFLGVLVCLAQTAQAEAQEIQVRTHEMVCPGGGDREAV